MYFASDTHIETESNPSYDDWWKLGTAYTEALAPVIGSEFIGFPGDIVYGVYDLDLAVSVLNEFPNHFCVIGNHDMGLSATNKSLVVSAFGLSSSYYAFDYDFMRIIVLDTNYDASGNDYINSMGRISDTEFTWLANELATTTQPGVVLVTHHTPIDIYTGGGGLHYFDTDDIAQLTTLANSRSNVTIVCGHLHYPNGMYYNLGNVPVYSLPALCVAGQYGRFTFVRAGSAVWVSYSLLAVTI
jgi:hypothetical protein